MNNFNRKELKMFVAHLLIAIEFFIIGAQLDLCNCGSPFASFGSSFGGINTNNGGRLRAKTRTGIQAVQFSDTFTDSFLGQQSLYAPSPKQKIRSRLTTPTIDADDMRLNYMSLQHFLEAEAKELIDPVQFCSNPSAPIASKLDMLAIRLEEAVSKGSEGSLRLLRQFAEAIKFDDIVHQKSRTFAKYVTDDLKEALFNDTLQPDFPTTNEFGEKRSVRKLKEEFIEKISRLPQSEMFELLKAIGEAENLDCAKKNSLNRVRRSVGQLNDTDRSFGRSGTLSSWFNPECMKERLTILLKRCLDVGLRLLDNIYLSPEALLELPMIGHQIETLRKTGKPLYEIISFVRHATVVAKVTSKGYVSPEEERQAEESRKLMNHYGVKALSRLGSALSVLTNKEIDENSIHELVSKASSCLLAMVAPQTQLSCDIRDNKNNNNNNNHNDNDNHNHNQLENDSLNHNHIDNVIDTGVENGGDTENAVDSDSDNDNLKHDHNHNDINQESIYLN